MQNFFLFLSFNFIYTKKGDHILGLSYNMLCLLMLTNIPFFLSQKEIKLVCLKNMLSVIVLCFYMVLYPDKGEKR